MRLSIMKFPSKVFTESNFLYLHLFSLNTLTTLKNACKSVFVEKNNNSRFSARNVLQFIIIQNVAVS